MNNYVLEGVKGFSDVQFYKALKTRYKLYKVFLRENPKFPKELIGYLGEIWDSIEELSVKDCFAEENTEKRSVLFSAFGPENILKNSNAVVIDKQTITKTNIKIVDGKEVKYKFDDTYTLYSIDKKELIGETGKLCMIHCKCTSTDKDYYLWVDSYQSDAIEAVASTFRVPVQVFEHEKIEAIYRHGDVLLLEVPEDLYLCGTLYPISKEIYLSKLKIES